MTKTLKGFVFGLPLGMLGTYLALRRRRQTAA
jgi:MYXO-CTERM domain-containing protein